MIIHSNLVWFHSTPSSFINPMIRITKLHNLVTEAVPFLASSLTASWQDCQVIYQSIDISSHICWYRTIDQFLSTCFLGSLQSAYPAYHFQLKITLSIHFFQTFFFVWLVSTIFSMSHSLFSLFLTRHSFSLRTSFSFYSQLLAF